MESIDKSVFEGLVASAAGDKAFVAELIETFLSDSPNLFALMHATQLSNDCDGFRRAAHTLKSTSASFGAMTLSGQAKELEMIAKAGTLEGTAEKLPRAQQEYDRVQGELKQWLGR